jgi:large subunit ribosomal protein L4
MKHNLQQKKLQWQHKRHQKKMTQRRQQTMASTKKPTTEKVTKAPAKSAPKTTSVENTSVSADVVDLTGKTVETMTLPEAIFAAKVNNVLMAQAVRVYRANQRVAQASTKTRGEVTGSTRKIYRQKGTGRARHGGITAPIFVGGGVAHGPRAHDYSMSMPQKMRKAALFSALTVKQQGNGIKVVNGLEKIEPKTKAFVTFLKNISLDDKKKVLLVLPAKTESVARSARNIEGVSYSLANQLNTYEVLNTKTVIFMKDAIETLEKTFLPKGGNA